MLQDDGTESLITTIAGVMTNGQFGTNTQALSRTDGGVLTPVAATDLALTTKTVSGNTVQCKHVVPLLTGNGNTFAENEITLSDSNAICRNLVYQIAKTDVVEVHAFTIFTIDTD